MTSQPTAAGRIAPLTRGDAAVARQSFRLHGLPGLTGKIGAGEGIRTLDPNLGKVVRTFAGGSSALRRFEKGTYLTLLSG